MDADAKRSQPNRETVTVEEAGAVLGISRATAYRLASTGELPVLRLGGRLLVPRIRLDRLLSGALDESPA